MNNRAQQKGAIFSKNLLTFRPESAIIKPSKERNEVNKNDPIQTDAAGERTPIG